MNYKIKTIILACLVTVLCVGTVTFGSTIINYFYEQDGPVNGIGANSLYRVIKRDNGYVMPVTSTDIIGSSTIGGYFNTATATTICLTGDSCITAWSAGSMTALPHTQVFVGDSSNAATATSTITVLNSGYVGIGTTTPTEMLSIGGTGKILIGHRQSTGGKLRVDLSDADTEVQAIKTYITRTTGTNYGYNGTAAGVGADNNIALYAYATGATGNNWGLQVASGLSYMQNRLGLLDGSPEYMLEIASTSADGYLGVTSSADGDIFVINNSGYVGIATSSPAYTLDVYGNARITSNLTVGATTTISGISYNWPDTDGTATYALVTDGNGQLSWGEAGTSINFLSDINNVSTTTLADGYILKWNATDAEWQSTSTLNTFKYEMATSTASQTVFDLTGMTYDTGDHELEVFVNGVYQVITDSYIETDSDTVTFNSGLNENDVVVFAVRGGIVDAGSGSQLTEEEVEDYVGGMVTGNTETGLTVEYQDADGTIDFALSFDTLAGFNVLIGDTIASTTANLSVFTNDAGFITASTTQATFTGNVWGTFIGNLTGDVTGNADTATKLAANGANCAAGSYALGIDDDGAVETCTDATTEIDSAIATHTGDNDAHHALVTLAGQDYLTLSTQAITAGEIEPDDLAGSDFGDFTCDGDTCTLDDTFLTASTSDISFTGSMWGGTYYGTWAGTALTDAQVSNTLTASIVSDADKGNIVISSGVWSLDTDAVDNIGEIAAALKDGSGDCGSGLICLGDHTHSGYLENAEIDTLAELNAIMGETIASTTNIWDVSDYTNLTAGDHITLTDDDLDIDDDFLLNTGDSGTGDYSITGNATTTGISVFTDGTNGLRIIPGASTSLIFF